VSAPEWTLEQAAELVLEHFLELLDGCDNDDVVRPALVLEAIRQAWAPAATIEPLGEVSAGEIRRRLLAARAGLARGERIP
jgi:hypothetical protein